MASMQLIKPDAGQTVTVVAEKDITLELGFAPDEAMLTREGDNLVFTFEDGSKLELTNFYATHTKESLPDFVVDGATIAGSDFFAALSEDLQPAAGPAAAAVANGGGRFSAYGDAALADGLDRLDGLDVGFTQNVQPVEQPAAAGAVGAATTVAAAPGAGVVPGAGGAVGDAGGTGGTGGTGGSGSTGGTAPSTPGGSTGGSTGGTDPGTPGNPLTPDTPSTPGTPSNPGGSTGGGGGTDPSNPGGGGGTDPGNPGGGGGTDPGNPGGGGGTDPGNPGGGTDPGNPGGGGGTDPGNPGGGGGTDPGNPGGGGGTDPGNPGGGGGTDPENPGGGGGTDPENPGGGGGTDPENPGGGGGTDPENPGGGGGTDPENPGGGGGLVVGGKSEAFVSESDLAKGTDAAHDKDNQSDNPTSDETHFEGQLNITGDPDAFRWTADGAPKVNAMVDGKWTEVKWEVSEDGTTLTGKAGGADVLEVKYTGGANHEYTVDLKTALQHEDGKGANSDIFGSSQSKGELNFGFTVSKGETEASGELSVSVKDDTLELSDSKGDVAFESGDADVDFGNIFFGVSDKITTTNPYYHTSDGPGYSYDSSAKDNTGLSDAGIKVSSFHVTYGSDGKSIVDMKGEGTVHWNNGGMFIKPDRFAGNDSYTEGNDERFNEINAYKDAEGNFTKSEALVFDLPGLAVGLNITLSSFYSKGSDAAPETGVATFYRKNADGTYELVGTRTFGDEGNSGDVEVSGLNINGAYFDRVVISATDNGGPDDNSDFKVSSVKFDTVNPDDIVGYESGKAGGAASGVSADGLDPNSFAFGDIPPSLETSLGTVTIEKSEGDLGQVLTGKGEDGEVVFTMTLSKTGAWDYIQNKEFTVEGADGSGSLQFEFTAKDNDGDIGHANIVVGNIGGSAGPDVDDPAVSYTAEVEESGVVLGADGKLETVAGTDADGNDKHEVEITLSEADAKLDLDIDDTPTVNTDGLKGDLAGDSDLVDRIIEDINDDIKIEDGKVFINIDEDSINELAEGDELILNYTMKGEDGTERNFDVVITGTNDRPEIVTDGKTSLGDTLEDMVKPETGTDGDITLTYQKGTAYIGEMIPKNDNSKNPITDGDVFYRDGEVKATGSATAKHEDWTPQSIAALLLGSEKALGSHDSLIDALKAWAPDNDNILVVKAKDVDDLTSADVKDKIVVIDGDVTLGNTSFSNAGAVFVDGNLTLEKHDNGSASDNLLYVAGNLTDENNAKYDGMLVVEGEWSAPSYQLNGSGKDSVEVVPGDGSEHLTGMTFDYADLTGTAKDVDRGAELHVRVAVDTLPDGVTVAESSDGKGISFEFGEKFDGAGEFTFDYQVVDEHNAASDTVTVTVTVKDDGEYEISASVDPDNTFDDSGTVFEGSDGHDSVDAHAFGLLGDPDGDMILFDSNGAIVSEEMLADGKEADEKGADDKGAAEGLVADKDADDKGVDDKHPGDEHNALADSDHKDTADGIEDHKPAADEQQTTVDGDDHKEELVANSHGLTGDDNADSSSHEGVSLLDTVVTGNTLMPEPKSSSTIDWDSLTPGSSGSVTSHDDFTSKTSASNDESSSKSSTPTVTSSSNSHESASSSSSSSSSSESSSSSYNNDVSASVSDAADTARTEIEIASNTGGVA